MTRFALLLLCSLPLAALSDTQCSSSDGVCAQDKGDDSSVMLQVKTAADAADQRPKCNICKGEKAKFQKGKEIPFWKGRTCNSGELTWACERDDSDGGKKFLKQFCCDDGPYPEWAKKGLVKKQDLPKDFAKCLCGDAKFKEGKKIPHWGGRVCAPGELDWACKRPDTDGGKMHLMKSCCEFKPDDLPEEDDGPKEDEEEEDGPPPCAATCPRNKELTCKRLKKYIRGCASSCPKPMKARYLKMICEKKEEEEAPAPTPAPEEDKPEEDKRRRKPEEEEPEEDKPEEKERAAPEPEEEEPMSGDDDEPMSGEEDEPRDGPADEELDDGGEYDDGAVPGTDNPDGLSFWQEPY